MKVYFLSSTPCCLTLNGAYFGVTDLFERFAEIQPADKVFAKFTPQNGLPIGFFITEDLRVSPPDGCEIYLLPDGVAVYARDFPPSDFSIRILSQKRENDMLATLFQQGVLQLSLQTSENFFVATLPPSFAQGEVFFYADLCWVKGQNCLAGYTKMGKCVFLEEIIEFSMQENTLNATLPLSDRLGRIADCRWNLSEKGCERVQFTLRQKKSEDTDDAPSAELLAYAFFESLYLGLDYARFLHDELLAQADKIPSFLGEMEGVVPSENPLRCGLIYKKAERVFEVRYYTVEIKENKIFDING